MTAQQLQTDSNWKRLTNKFLIQNIFHNTGLPAYESTTKKQKSACKYTPHQDTKVSAKPVPTNLSLSDVS